MKILFDKAGWSIYLIGNQVRSLAYYDNVDAIQVGALGIVVLSLLCCNWLFFMFDVAGPDFSLRFNNHNNLWLTVVTCYVCDFPGNESTADPVVLQVVACASSYFFATTCTIIHYVLRSLSGCINRPKSWLAKGGVKVLHVCFHKKVAPTAYFDS